MLEKLKAGLDGKKTYITLGLGVLVAVAGNLFGPIDLPGSYDIPAVSSSDMWKIIWEGLAATFLRAGIASKSA